MAFFSQRPTGTNNIQLLCPHKIARAAAEGEGVGGTKLRRIANSKLQLVCARKQRIRSSLFFLRFYT